MKNDTCVICGEKFKYSRNGKLYCGDSCKQTAYERKKKEKEDTTVKIETVIENEIVKTNRIIIFSLPEFKEVLEKLPKEISSCLDYYRYFFLRKNISGKPNIDQIIEYILLFKEQIESDSFNDVGTKPYIYIQYQEFLKEFHNESKYQIMVSKE